MKTQEAVLKKLQEINPEVKFEKFKGEIPNPNYFFINADISHLSCKLVMFKNFKDCYLQSVTDIGDNKRMYSFIIKNQ